VKATPWAVLCPTHGQVFLTKLQYDKQISEVDARWSCPRCGALAEWDDDNNEQYLDD
jgi:hypothetical protein